MKIIKSLYLTLFYFFICSCSSSGSDQPPAAAPAPTITAEEGFCSTNMTYASPVVITGTATFFKRGLTVTTSAGVVTQMTLSTPISTSLPIQFAEVRVLNSAGQIIQCGQTDSTGSLKAIDGSSNLNISSTAGNYTVEVTSRSQYTFPASMGKNSFNFTVSVKKDIYSNAFYKLSQSITSTGSGSISVGNMIAYARESESSEVLGGAFNIYNDLLVTYKYLSQNTGLSNLTCLNPKLDVYWKAGFNPAQYIYPDDDPSSLGTVSYYVRGENELYINGGVLGNVASKDTDHFDDAVIIHELGHHIEDVCGKMDSPGGAHYGLYRIDSRLAWSEGWGNFFGAHVIRNNLASINPDLSAQLPASGWLHYLDTDGYNDGAVTSGSRLIMLNLTKPGNNPEAYSVSLGLYYDKVNSALYPGEGHTREVSISRSLFKGTNTCASLCSNTNYFSYYWKAFENDLTGVGIGKPNFPFRSSIVFYSRLNQAFINASTTTPASIDSILNSDEAQQRDTNSAYTVSGAKIWAPYGIKLVANGATACSLKILPRADTASVTNLLSDQRYSNHFYLIDRSVLPSVTEINLSATKLGGTTVDIDLILLKEGYRFTEDCASYNSSGNCTSYQKMTSADMLLSDRSNSATAGTTLTKKIQNLTSLSSSNYYLLDIRAYTAGNSSITNATEYTYTLTDQSGGYLCPSPTY